MKKPTIDIAAGKEVILSCDESGTSRYVYEIYGTSKQIEELNDFLASGEYEYEFVIKKGDHNGSTSAMEINW